MKYMKSFFKRLYVLFIITFSFMFMVSCCHKIKISSDYKNATTNIYPETSISFKSEHYAFVEVSISHIDDKPFPLAPMFTSTGSGAIVKHIGSKSYILTAKHVCEMPIEEIPPPVILEFGDSDKESHSLTVSIKVHNILKNVYDAKIHAVSKQHDMCLLEVDSIVGEPLNIAKSDPILGDKLITMFSPLGVGVRNSAPIIDGYYSGSDPDGNYLITIPSAPGASGGLAVNEKGEAVCIIYAVLIEFHHLTLCGGRQNIIEFMNNNL